MDDQCYVTSAAKLATLAVKAQKMVGIVAEVFKTYALKFNWAPGKSAGMLKLRKSGAHQVMNALRDDAGTSWLALPT